MGETIFCMHQVAGDSLIFMYLFCGLEGSLRKENREEYSELPDP